GRHVRVARVPASRVHDAHWTRKQWTVLGDRKLNGAGSGFFEYEIPWPAGLNANDVASATFLVEASAKRLNGKDRDSTVSDNGDYMRGGGFHDPSRNPNSYPMTGATPFRSAVTVRVNGQLAGPPRFDLPDDPADSRGILSWHAQPHDGHLYEAGSYGELLHVPVPADAIREAARRAQRRAVDAHQCARHRGPGDDVRRHHHRRPHTGPRGPLRRHRARLRQSHRIPERLAVLRCDRRPLCQSNCQWAVH